MELELEALELLQEEEGLTGGGGADTCGISTCDLGQTQIIIIE